MATTSSRRCRKRIRLADRKITAWLRKCISSVDYGKKAKGPGGHPIHLNRKVTIIEAFNSKNWRRLNRLSNRDLGKHFTGQEPFYFAGNGRTRDTHTLAMIDIDCHSCGTFKGALGFANYLKKHLYPDMYFEPSTNGNGVHGYLLIHKMGFCHQIVNDALARLQAFLQKTLAETSFDVETVEIKGHCPVIGWSEQPGKIEKLTMGQLAKLPQQALFRQEELKHTTVLDCFDLLQLPKPEKILLGGKGNGKRPPASITGCVLSTQELAKTHTTYLRLANLLLNHHCLKTSSKAAVEAMGVSIFLMFLLFFSWNMNIDRTLPWARFKKFWDVLYASKEIDRPFQCNRLASIRNYFFSLGLIQWTDETYRIGAIGSDGKKRGGRACKWMASRLLLQLIQLIEQSEKSAGQIPETVVEYDKEDGERASLTTTNTIDDIKNLRRFPYSETKRPQQVYDPPPLILLPEEVSKYLTPIEDIHSIAL